MSEEEAIRSIKKISRAGSGGYSIYLPKRWIDRWSEQQKSDKEVEMFEVGNQLIIGPRSGRKSLEKELKNASREELIYQMLSAYVNGVDDFTLRQEGLSDIDMAELRNIIRFLDEDLLVRTDRCKIIYENRPVITQDVESLLPLLFDKIIEAENLAAELLNDCDTDISHSIHIMRLMYAIEKEDVNRLSLQIFRNLSKFRTPARDFVDINFRWNSANMLEIIGDSLYNMVRTVCKCYGIDPEDLQYPAEYLVEKVVSPDEVLGDANKLRMQLVIDLREAATMLSKAKEAIISGDAKGAFDHKDELREQVKAMESELANSIIEFCTSPPGGSVSFLAVMRIVIGAREVMYLTKSLTKRAALIYFSF